MTIPTFPLLLSGRKLKRSADDQASELTAKRRKRILPENEYNSSLDNFFFFDIDSFERVSFGHPVDQQEAFSAITGNEDCGDDPHQQLQRGTLHQDQGHLGRVISAPQLSANILEPNVVSPFLNPTKSVSSACPHPHQPPGLEMPSPQVDSSIAFSISALKRSEKPTLLTLTSYPYRIIYCNEAFSKLCGRGAPEIGDSVFDAFEIEGRILRPCLATYPTLQGRLDEKIALVRSFVTDDDEQDNQYYWIRCGVQAYPVHKQDGSNALLYFAVRFTPLQNPL